MSKMSKNSNAKTKNQNINVAVRCRPINNIEKKQGSCSILSCDRIKHEVTIKEKGGIHPFTKTYNFDHVFGPDSLQIDLYKAVVKPVVEEVLTGYNCTIFAYGQTGTGKTFTMEGERSGNGNLSWEDDPLSGVIPRALHQIFDDLQKQPDVEFSLRVSFMELYNEELFDLLGSSLDPLRLRIYEDNSKKGSVIISGLEEVVVRTKDEVFEILQRGTAKRQTAATLMNDTSSRSHSVFSVTIHIKENTIDGEELLKTGKLYLVDLAGSENIGRSGAVDKRAREAGNINQSLLTLGRVITALVDHAPHIPYRESKLTRLLQDSLGGRTKTSIIATISPAACNFEETISTLDYAFRAKNITNRPEVNQKLTKKALLKEYTEEIERLRRDLQASREKNGIYIAQDNYTYIQNKLASQGDSLQEYEDKIATLTQEMKTLTDMFNDTRETLIATSEKLVTTSVQLDETSKELDVTKSDLKETRQDRNEQKFLVSEHVQNEGSLFTEAKQLMSTVETTISDVDGLHEKVDRKKAVEEHNDDALTIFRDRLSQHVTNLRMNMDGLNTKKEKFSHQISGAINESLNVHTKSSGDIHKEINGMRSFFDDHVNDLSSHQKVNEKSFSKTANSLLENIETIKSKSLSHLNGMNRKMLSKFEEISEKGKGHPLIVASMKAAIQEQEKEHANLLTLLVDNMENMTGDFVQITHGYLEDLALEDNVLKEETEKHFEQMSELDEQILLLMQKKKELRIQYTNHVQKLKAGRAAAMASFQTSLKSKETEIRKTWGDAAEKINSFMEQRSVAHVESWNKVHATFANVQEGCQGLSELETEFVTESQENCNQSTEVLKVNVSEMLVDSSSRFSRSQEMVQTMLSEYNQMSSSACEAARQGQELMSRSLEHQRDMCKDHDSVVSSAITSQKDQLKDTVDMFTSLFDDELKRDIPTGRTPQRTTFSYPRSLTKTRQHQKLLEQFRISQQKEAAELEAVTEQEKNNESPVLDLMGSLDNLSDIGSVAGMSVASTSGISISSSVSKFSELDDPKENEPKVKKAPSSIKKTKPKTPARTFKKPTTVRAKLPLKPSN